MQKKLFLLDAYALIFRAYYAFINSPRKTSKGFNTSAIFGFVNALLDVIQKEKPSHIAVAFDSSAKTFRHDKFPAYKANREATPEDIKLAVPYIKQILDALNITIYEMPGFEADDIIGTVSKQSAKLGFLTYMMTPDKDFCQLVNNDVLLYKPSRAGNGVDVWGVNEVIKSFEIEYPLQVIDILGLWGDASDNIPGAPGIGEKTAKKLIKEYGSIEVLLHNVNKLQGKVKESLINNREQVLLSKELATICTTAPISFREDESKLVAPDLNKIVELFNELEFKTLLSRIPGTFKTNIENPDAKQQQPTETNQQNLFVNQEHVNITNNKTIKDFKYDFISITNSTQIRECLEEIKINNFFCFDIITSSDDIFTSEIIGISFCVSDKKAYFLYISQNKEEAKNQLSNFKEIFSSDKITKCNYNIKHNKLILKSFNIEVAEPFFDIMIAHYLIQPDIRHNFEFLSQTYLNYLTTPIENNNKKEINQLNFRLLSIDAFKNYLCERVVITYQLKLILETDLAKNNLWELFSVMEMPLISVLSDVEFNGVKIDEKTLNDYSVILKSELRKFETEIYALANQKFNVNSPKQLGEILFEKLKIVSDAKRTKTKQYSTSEEELTKYIEVHPIINKILEYRSVQKLISTYADALPMLVNKATKKIHTSFNQAVTATGRLSSTNPNLQNIPVKEERGREIRKAFVTTNNNLFLSADYSQIELRLMAHLSQDASMLEDFLNNQDIHTATASKIFKVAATEVTREQRGKAKTANFGIIYGISAFGLSQRLNISRSEAKQLIEQYFETYPGVKKYMLESIAIAREKGYIETMFGRKRVLSDINSRNSIVRGMAERNAINAPIQGTAADIIKIAMIKIARILKSEKLNSKMILQVHDELDFEVPENEIELVKNVIKNEMENAVSLSIPLIVEVGVGKNWLEAH